MEALFPKAENILLLKDNLSSPLTMSVMRSRLLVLLGVVLNRKMSKPSPAVRISLPSPPLRMLLASLPVIVLALILPLPLIAVVPLRIRF